MQVKQEVESALFALQLLNSNSSISMQAHLLRTLIVSLERLLSIAKEGLGDLKTLVLPEKGASFEEFIAFFKKDYFQMFHGLKKCHELLNLPEELDNLTDIHFSDVSLETSVGRFKNLIDEYHNLINEITYFDSLHSDVLLEGHSAIENYITRGSLNSLNEARAYYWLAFVLHPQRSIFENSLSGFTMSNNRLVRGTNDGVILISSKMRSDEYQIPNNWSILVKNGDKVVPQTPLAKRGKVDIVAEIGGKVKKKVEILLFMGNGLVNMIL